MNIQRLLPCTPRPVICFLAGSLPGTALLHLRQLTIFGMICRLPENILHTHACNIFGSLTPSSKSWFLKIRELCLQYILPHPLQLLNSPPPKETFKNLIKKHVINYWEQVLRLEASVLDSLVFFKPIFMSLTTPHPLWSTAGSSPAKVAMATIQAQMISGRYRTELLCSHWSKNKSGFCLLSASCSSTVEDLPHLLSSCTALKPTREKLLRFTHNYCKELPYIKEIIINFCNPASSVFSQFLLDCSSFPSVIIAAQQHGDEVHHHLFHITRTWVYTLHKVRMKKLGRWNKI